MEQRIIQNQNEDYLNKMMSRKMDPELLEAMRHWLENRDPPDHWATFTFGSARSSHSCENAIRTWSIELACSERQHISVFWAADKQQLRGNCWHAHCLLSFEIEPPAAKGLEASWPHGNAVIRPYLKGGNAVQYSIGGHADFGHLFACPRNQNRCNRNPGRVCFFDLDPSQWRTESENTFRKSTTVTV